MGAADPSNPQSPEGEVKKLRETAPLDFALELKKLMWLQHLNALRERSASAESIVGLLQQQLDALREQQSAPKQPPNEVAPEKTAAATIEQPPSSKDWLVAEVERRAEAAEAGDVPLPLTISQFVAELWADMKKAYAKGRVKQCYASRESLEQRLRDYELWPVPKPKKKPKK